MKAILELVRCGLWQRDFDKIHKPENWITLLNEAHRHSVAGLFCDASIKSGILGNNALEQKFANDVLWQIQGQHRRHNAVIDRVYGLLDAAGIGCVLLKGQGLAERYAVSELRQCGDVDMYVNPDDFDRACILLDAIRDKDARRKLSRKHYAVFVDGVEIELHHHAEHLCNPWLDKRFQEWTITMLAQSVRGSHGSWLVPSDDFNVVYVFCHLWNHFEIAGIGLRQLCDMAVLVSACRGRIDTTGLETNLRRFHMLEKWRIIGCFLVEQLGLEKADFPLYQDIAKDKAEGFADIVTEGGNLGQNGRDAFFGRHRKWPFAAVKAVFYVRQFCRVWPFAGTSLIWRVLRKTGVFDNKLIMKLL